MPLLKQMIRKLLRGSEPRGRLLLSGNLKPAVAFSGSAGTASKAQVSSRNTVDSSAPFVRIKSADQLPDGLAVLNAEGGALATFSTLARVALAVLTGDQKSFIVLNGDTAIQSGEHRQLRGALRQQQFEVVATYVAPQQLFESLTADSPAAGDIAPPAPAEPELRRFVPPAAGGGMATIAPATTAAAGASDLLARNAARSVANFYRIMEKGVALGASDVHFCVREKGAKVLMRIFGQIEQIMSLTREEALEALGVAYNKLASENSRSRTAHQFNPRDKQYCTIELTLGGTRWRIRYQSTNVEGGLDVVLRLLASDMISESKSLQNLGYSSSQCEQLRLGLMRAVGATFMAGVTGSGKSTTLKTLATMDPLRASSKWYSVEDPVEYRITKVSQIPVQRDTSDEDNLPFVEAFRALMRMDPDSILIGEIRDKESADLFGAAVMSGHRCLTTVHASSAIAIASRLCSEPILMPRAVLAGKGFISLLVYQTLLPELCPHCRRPAADGCEPDYLAYIAGKFEVDVSGMQVSSGTSCGQPKCRNGIIGRTVAAEIVTASTDMRVLLLEGKDIDVERMWRRSRWARFDDEDMTGKTAFEHGLYKSLQGQVDPRDLEANFESFQTYELMQP